MKDEAVLRYALHALLLPYYATVGFLFAVGVMIASLFGEEIQTYADERLRMFFWGNYSDMSEEVARNIINRSQAIRDKGFFENLKFSVRNNHVLLAIFFCEPYHPFAPFKRIVIFLVISIYSYIASVMKNYWIPSEDGDIDFAISIVYDVFIITFPSMVAGNWLQTGVLWYSHEHVARILESKRRERKKQFVKQLIYENNLLQYDHPSTISTVFKRGGTELKSAMWFGRSCSRYFMWLFSLLYNLVMAIGRFLKAFYDAEMLFVQYGEQEMISTLVVGGAFQISVAAFVIVLQFDHHEAVANFAISLALNVFLFSFLSMYVSFRLQWILEHPTTSQTGLDAVILKIQRVVLLLRCSKESTSLDEPQVELMDVYVLFSTGCNKQRSAFTVASVFHIVDAYCRDRGNRGEYRVSVKDVEKFVAARRSAAPPRDCVVKTATSEEVSKDAKTNGSSSKYVSSVMNALHWRRGSGKSFDTPVSGNNKGEETKSTKTVEEYLTEIERLEKRLIDGRLLYLISDARKKAEKEKADSSQGEVETPQHPLELNLIAVEFLQDKLDALNVDLGDAKRHLAHTAEGLVSLPGGKEVIKKEIQPLLDMCNTALASVANLLSFIDQQAELMGGQESKVMSFKSFEPMQKLLKVKESLDKELDALHCIELEENHLLPWQEFNDRYFQSYCKASNWAWLLDDIQDKSVDKAQGEAVNAEMTSVV